MIIFPVLFLMLIIWSLKDDEIYWKEATIWTVVFLVFFIGSFLLKGFGLICMAGSLIVTVSLVIRVFGRDIVIH